MVVQQGEKGLKEKEKVVLFAIISEEIKDVRDKAILLHKKRSDETESKFKQLLDKKVEKCESEKHLLTTKVEKYGSENSHLKKALGAARVTRGTLYDRTAQNVFDVFDVFDVFTYLRLFQKMWTVFNVFDVFTYLTFSSDI